MTEKTEDEGYGISYLATSLDMQPQNVRQALRRLKVEKNDNRYRWSRKSDADAVVKQLRGEAKPARAEKAPKEEKSSKGEKTSAAAKAAERRAEKKPAAAAKAGKGKTGKGKAKEADEE